LKTICYYISDYGYGHATRSIAIIRELLKKCSDLRIIICNSFASDFISSSLKDSLYKNRVTIRHVKNDIGFILKKNSINPDIEEFQKEYQQFIQEAEEYISGEIKFLKNNEVDLVIGDIPPYPFKAAKKLRTLSIGISNFTWFLNLSLVLLIKTHP
jgi:hypothetical protein